MNYSASLNLTPLSAGNAATYFDLMTQTDANGQPLTYLGTEENFAYHQGPRGPESDRAGGRELLGAESDPRDRRPTCRSRGATVAAFYVSTVEPYLKRDGSFPAFCANVATLPMDDASVFIRPGNIANLGAGGAVIAPPAPGAPRIGTYQIGVIVPMATGCS